MFFEIDIVDKLGFIHYSETVALANRDAADRRGRLLIYINFGSGPTAQQHSFEIREINVTNTLSNR